MIIKGTFMKKGIKSTIIFTLLIFGILLIVISCKPINIFSPLVDPSKMGNEAKLDAGYNALASGNYDDAIDYFTSVINSGSESEKTDAYLGRASAYLHSAAPNLDDVVSDLVSGNVSADDTGDIIDQVVGDNEFDDFFESVQNAANDYNSAVGESTSGIDAGVLLEAYQTNMMAATGVGAQTIADAYNDSPWGTSSTNPIVGSTTYNDELDAILDSSSTHPFNISTWTIDDANNPSTNGLYEFIVNKNNTTAQNSMISYLTEAYNDLEQLKSDPPEGMTVSDLSDMQNTILQWANYGLGDNSLGTPSP